MLLVLAGLRINQFAELLGFDVRSFQSLFEIVDFSLLLTLDLLALPPLRHQLFITRLKLSLQELQLMVLPHDSVFHLVLVANLGS